MKLFQSTRVLALSLILLIRLVSFYRDARSGYNFFSNRNVTRLGGSWHNRNCSKPRALRHNPKDVELLRRGSCDFSTDRRFEMILGSIFIFSHLFFMIFFWSLYVSFFSYCNFVFRLKALEGAGILSKPLTFPIAQLRILEPVDFFDFEKRVKRISIRWM